MKMTSNLVKNETTGHKMDVQHKRIMTNSTFITFVFVDVNSNRCY